MSIQMASKPIRLAISKRDGSVRCKVRPKAGSPARTLPSTRLVFILIPAADSTPKLCRHRSYFSDGIDRDTIHAALAYAPTRTISMPKLAANNLASQRELAYRSLRRLLVLQQVEPGQRLREPQWAERLRVHRTALREAFARLEAEGMIERGERTGYFVPVLTVEDYAEVAKLRLALECLAIEEVCAAAAPSLAALEQACEEFARLLQGGYSLGAIEADRRFHEALIDAARMRR